MKTIRLALFAVLCFTMQAKMRALAPATTYTFVNPCQPFAIITAIYNTYGCYSFSATNAGASDPNDFYTWNFGDGIVDTGDYVYHCYSPVTANTVYTVEVGYVSAALCGFAPTVQNYTLALSPPSPTNCVAPVASVSLTASSVTVWAGVIIPETMFEYNFGDGVITMTTNAHTYTNCGNYIIKVKSWDWNMPQNTCYRYAAVNISCPVTLPTTGIENNRLAKGNVLLFPNPSSEIVNIKSETPINGIKIVDVLGREVFSENNIRNTEMTIKVSELSAGTYFLKCGHENGAETHIKFSKE